MAQVQVAEATFPVTQGQSQTSYAEILVRLADIAEKAEVIQEESPEYSAEVLSKAIQMRLYELVQLALEDIGDGVIEPGLAKWMEHYRKQESQVLQAA